MNQETPTKTELIIAGLGGMGVLSAGNILATAALKKYKYASWLPGYGSEKRGGLCECTMVISDEDDLRDSAIYESEVLVKRFLDCSMMVNEGVLDTRSADLVTNESLLREFSWMAHEWEIVVEWADGNYSWSSGSQGSLSYALQAPLVIYKGEFVPGRVTVIVWD